MRKPRRTRTVAVEGMDVDEFIRRNADPIWLHQNEMWEMLQECETVGEIEVQEESNPDNIPF